MTAASAVQVGRCAHVEAPDELLARRRVLWDYLGGALWVLPTMSVMAFLIAGALLSRVSVDADWLSWPLAFKARPRTPAGPWSWCQRQ